MKREVSLSNFFNPKTIAIIGASDHIDKVGGILMKNSLKSNCNVIPINPNHDSLFGIKCYKGLIEFSGVIDLAIIAIRAEFVVASLEECGKKGIKNVIIISAGFSEVGNKTGEQKIKEIANKYGIRFLGPNCFGIFSSASKLDLTFAINTPSEGDVALISQSGAMWSFMSDIFSDIGFSGFVGLGNMGDLEFDDFLDYFSRDKQTKSIILYIEKLKDGKRFIELAKNCKKKIYAVKAGSSSQGSKAAFSHTGSLATDYLVYKGVFKQSGVILCETLEDAFRMASGKKLFFNKNNGKINLEKDSRIIPNAGGAGVLTSDYLEEKATNVLESRDIIGTALAKDYAAALDDLKNFEGSIFVILTGQSMSEIDKTAQVVADFKKQTGKSIVALFLGGKSMESANEIFKKNEIIFFNDFESFRSSL